MSRAGEGRDICLGPWAEIRIGGDEERAEALSKSGLRMTRACSAVSAYAALASRMIMDEVGVDPSRVAVGVMSTSSTLGPSTTFLEQGRARGWHLIDPFLLPNTILSAAATHASLRCGLRGGATTYSDAGMGVLFALAHLGEALRRGSLEAGILVVAEDPGAAHVRAARGAALPAGAVAVAISMCGPYRVDRFGFGPTPVGEGSGSRRVEIGGDPFAALHAWRSVRDLAGSGARAIDVVVCGRRPSSSGFLTVEAA